MSFFFFFNDTATTEIYTLSLHDALPIYRWRRASDARQRRHEERRPQDPQASRRQGAGRLRRRLGRRVRSEEHTSELQSRLHLVCRLLLEKKKKQSKQNERLVTQTKHACA